MKKLPNIEQNITDWYTEVIYQSELADQSPVRGCIVIRPYGYALWEQIKSVIDKRIKETGHENASFPLFIPESFLKKEAEHVEGFAPELAIVTYAGGKKLEEPLVVRPTSETMVHYMFARWIKSWRDLPLKINQWANVVRWEMRTRPFLRTTEIFWQEGHTAHETEKEAEDEAKMMLQEYVDFAHNYLAIPVIAGRKSESEKFAGADCTYTFEALMQDGKALQMGTSHIISRSFARSFGIEYQNREGKIDYPYLTSWAVTTRLIGALVMMHGDQKGLVLPPNIAPIQVVIIPIYRSDDQKEAVLKTAQELADKIKPDTRVKIDDDDQATPGAKFYRWELKGVPVRIEIGPRDLEKQQAVVANRLGDDKQQISLEKIPHEMPGILENIQKKLFERAQQKVQSLRMTGDKLEDFGPTLERDSGMYQTGWCQKDLCEAQLKRYKATIRCLLEETNATTCFNCTEKSKQDVLVAKAY